MLRQGNAAITEPPSATRHVAVTGPAPVIPVLVVRFGTAHVTAGEALHFARLGVPLAGYVGGVAA
jgi:phosphohistidine swiveling domain-containing protein